MLSINVKINNNKTNNNNNNNNKTKLRTKNNCVVKALKSRFICNYRL